MLCDSGGMNRSIALSLSAIALVAISLPGCRREPVGNIVGDAEAGRQAFAKCASCHRVGPFARSAFGPQLNGIVGRTAGSAGDFKYSSAMQNSGIVWTEQTLAAFLRDPEAVVPGNNMRFNGIGDERQVADLVAYLRLPHTD